MQQSISSPKIQIIPVFVQIGIKNKPISRATNASIIDGPIFCSTILSTHENRFFLTRERYTDPPERMRLFYHIISDSAITDLS